MIVLLAVARTQVYQLSGELSSIRRSFDPAFT
jgi:hypothetical protein